MKLSIRLTAAIMLALTCLMVVHTYLIVQREIDLFRTDLDRHVYLVGKALAAAVPDIWQVGGLERVRQLIRDANHSMGVYRLYCSARFSPGAPAL
jgi:hypothetical protein